MQPGSRSLRSYSTGGVAGTHNWATLNVLDAPAYHLRSVDTVKIQRADTSRTKPTLELASQIALFLTSARVLLTTCIASSVQLPWKHHLRLRNDLLPYIQYDSLVECQP